MRVAVTMLAILTTGGGSLAFADPPATPVAPESRSSATPSSTAEDSTGQNSADRTVPTTVAGGVFLGRWVCEGRIKRRSPS
jgi:hypothetical protein